MTKTIDSEREMLWTILSELYLDSPIDYPYIARELKNTPFSIEEIERTLFEEVHPALYQNVLSVAGQWGGWEKNWLIERIKKDLALTQSKKLGDCVLRMLRNLRSSFVSKMILNEWLKIKELLQQ